MLSEIRPAHLRMSGASLCHQMKRPFQVGQGPEKGLSKGRAFALNSNLLKPPSSLSVGANSQREATAHLLHSQQEPRVTFGGNGFGSGDFLDVDDPDHEPAQIRMDFDLLTDL